MTDLRRTPDGRLWRVYPLKGADIAELVGATGLKRTRTRNLSGMQPVHLEQPCQP